jgi:hypothetical protein
MGPKKRAVAGPIEVPDPKPVTRKDVGLFTRHEGLDTYF